MPTIADSYISADFVARFNIIKVYPNHADETFYKADIEIFEQFKGEKIESIYIAGQSDGEMKNSCDVFYPEGSQLLVAARANSDGKIVFGACSYTIDFNSRQKDNQRAQETISLLSNHYRHLTIRYHPRITSNFYEFLASKRGIKLTEKFALFEVILKKEYNANEVKIIKGFGGKIDSKIIKELLLSTWEISFYPKENKIEAPVKVVVPIYYYPEENGEKSILANFTI